MTELTKTPPSEPAELDPMPTQGEVDAIAHFVEAVRELKQSPFFIEEFSSLSLSMKKGGTRDEVTAHLPDPNVMRGVLLPFRRVWQQNEPCNFTRVFNYLKKYIPKSQSLIDSFAINKEQDAVNYFPAWKNEKLTYQDLIDVWLNTRYLHVGSSKTTGKFNRSDFDHLERQIGKVLFEYYFVWAVSKFGTSLFNIRPIAERFISDLAQRGLEPSFSMAGTMSIEGIRRTTPGFTPERESPSHRVWCLRRRRIFAAFNNFLRLADYPDQQAAELISDCDSFDAFILRAGITLSFQTEFERPEGQQFSAYCSVIEASCRPFESSLSEVASSERTKTILSFSEPTPFRLSASNTSLFVAHSRSNHSSDFPGVSQSRPNGTRPLLNAPEYRRPTSSSGRWKRTCQ